MKEFAIGIDLGGTNIRIALVNREGQITVSEEFPTQSDQPGKIIVHAISEQIETILVKVSCHRNEIQGIGLASAGFLSPQDGIIYFSPNLPTLSNFPVANLLERETGIRTILENDANAAAIGEHWLGSGKGTNNFIFITLGTGLGSGIILNGEIWHGTHGFAGEFGHTILFPDGLPCKCGRKGCLEMYCSASAIVHFAHEKLKHGENSSLNKESKSLTSRMIFEHALRGDSLACDTFKETGTYLGIALSNVFNLLDLQMAIIGGKVADAGDLILKPVRDVVERMAISSRYYPPQVLKSELGDNAGVLGAARLVFKNADCGIKNMN
jgi:glucokinase